MAGTSPSSVCVLRCQETGQNRTSPVLLVPTLIWYSLVSAQQVQWFRLPGVLKWGWTGGTDDSDIEETDYIIAPLQNESLGAGKYNCFNQIKLWFIQISHKLLFALRWCGTLRALVKQKLSTLDQVNWNILELSLCCTCVCVKIGVNNFDRPNYNAV